MVSVLELINPIYFLPIGAFFLIAVGCACYGCYDLFYPHPDFADSIAGGVIACDISDCPIPDIHEQHKIEGKSDGFWSKKAWGLETSSAENSTTSATARDYALMMIPPPTFGELNLVDPGHVGIAMDGSGGGGDGGGGCDGGCGGDGGGGGGD